MIDLSWKEAVIFYISILCLIFSIPLFAYADTIYQYKISSCAAQTSKETQPPIETQSPKYSTTPACKFTVAPTLSVTPTAIPSATVSIRSEPTCVKTISPTFLPSRTPSIRPTQTATAIITATPYNNNQITPTQTPSFTLTPTLIPTSIEQTSTLVCNAGGTYVAQCRDYRVDIELNAYAKGDGIEYYWRTDCPSSDVVNPNSANSSISINSFTEDKVPTACNVFLEVVDRQGKKETCISSVLVQSCYFDCAGNFQGSAKEDRCGVCNGDGQSCLGCNSLNIENTQLALDNNAATLRSLVFEAAKYLKSKGSTKTQKAFSKKMIIESQSLYREAWINTYVGVPRTILDCNSTNCIKTSNLDFKKKLALFSRTQSKLLKQALKLVTKSEKFKNSKINKLLIRSRFLIAQQQENFNSIPDLTSTCS